MPVYRVAQDDLYQSVRNVEANGETIVSTLLDGHDVLIFTTKRPELHTRAAS